MELLNATEMQAGYTMGLEPSGRELLVVAVKGTFAIPEPGGQVKLAEEQVPLVDADTFTGEPGISAPVYECDYAPHKPKCDVIVNGSAYAPGGIPTRRVSVGLSLGRVQKRFEVVGPRFWHGDVFGLEATEPEPFVNAPISYDHAFGGIDESDSEVENRDAYLPNPVGKGFAPSSRPIHLDGKMLPNTQEPGRPTTSPSRTYSPMAFGPIGRGWRPRSKYAGTYDQNWVDNIFPFLPPDFDDRYYQCAPEDQQTNYPVGGERVVLENLTSDGRLEFNLPTVDVPVTFYLRTYEEIEKTASCDTVAFEPDKRRFLMVWRATIPLRRNMFEVNQVIVGKMSPGWYRARSQGKIHHCSLRQLSDRNQKRRRRTDDISYSDED